MPPAFARGFPAHFQRRFGSNLMGPGAIRRLERNMQPRPSRTGRGHFFLCTWNAKKSYARGEPKKSSLDTATCSRDAWVTCNILRNNVLKRFSFRRVNWNWEWKCLWADGRGGRIASGSDPDLALRRANAATAAPCRNNCHKPSRSPCGHTQHKSGDPAQRKRTRFRVLFRVLRREKQEDQTNYMFNATPDALVLRKATNARPSSPVPSSNRLEGSGVAADS